MGQEASAGEPSFAIVCCLGSSVASTGCYEGIEDCKAAALAGIGGGAKECPYGCLGLGSCVKACPFGAMLVGEGGVPYVDESLCTGCKKCVEACPRGINRVDPESRTVFVLCRNTDRGAAVNKMCEHSCIACKKCEKECPFDAIHVINNLAVIDYDKCKLCGKCVKVCPKGVIVNLRKERRRTQESSRDRRGFRIR